MLTNPAIPDEALEKAQRVISGLRDQLSRLFDTIPQDYTIAIRFEAGEDQ